MGARAWGGGPFVRGAGPACPRCPRAVARGGVRGRLGMPNGTIRRSCSGFTPPPPRGVVPTPPPHEALCHPRSLSGTPPPDPGICLKGRGATGTIPEQLQSSQGTVKAVGGRLLAVEMRLGLVLGYGNCFGVESGPESLGTGGTPPPPSSVSLPRAKGPGVCRTRTGRRSSALCPCAYSGSGSGLRCLNGPREIRAVGRTAQCTPRQGRICTAHPRVGQCSTTRHTGLLPSPPGWRCQGRRGRC